MNFADFSKQKFGENKDKTTFINSVAGLRGQDLFTARQNTAASTKSKKKTVSDTKLSASAPTLLEILSLGTPDIAPKVDNSANLTPITSSAKGGAKTYAAGHLNTAATLSELQSRAFGGTGTSTPKDPLLSIFTKSIQNAKSAAEKETALSQLNNRLGLSTSPTGIATVTNPSALQRAAEVGYKEADRLQALGQADIERAKETVGPVGRFAIDAGVAGGQMLADAALGGGSALIPMALRTFGSGAQQARQEGASLNQQLAYGLGSAAVSAAAEKITSISKPFQSLFGPGVLGRAIEQATARLGQSAAGRMALSAVSESGEELLESILQPALQNLTYADGSKRYDREWLADTIYQGLIGAALGGIGGAVEIAGRNTGSNAQDPAAPAQPTAKENVAQPPSARVNYNALEAQAIQKDAKTFRNLVAGFDTKVSDFFKKWREGRVSQNGDKLEKLYLGKMPDAVRRQVSSILGYELDQRDFIITNDDVKHIFDRHGDADAEIKGNNIPLEQWMFDALPDVVTSPGTIKPGKIGSGKKNAGKQSVIFRKAFPGGTVVTVQFDNKGRGTMEINTLYAKKNEDTSAKLDTATGAAPNSTSETLAPVSSSDFTVSQVSGTVNPKQDPLLSALLEGKRVDQSQASNYHADTSGSIPTFEFYDSPIEIDGKQYNAHIRVKNTNVGDKYYGHTVSEIDDIKIEPPTRVPAPETLTGQPENTGGSMDLKESPSLAADNQSSPVEGTRPLNSDFTIAPGAENVNFAASRLENPAGGQQADGASPDAAQGAAAAPLSVGRVTTIQRPYRGKTPVQTQKSAAAVTVDSSSVTAAQNRIDGARGLDRAMPGKGFKATLKDAYKAVFRAARGVPVEGVTFEGRPYTVDIPNNVPGKVISDPNLTAEKLALLDILPQVVQNGEYVGSGEYVQHGRKEKPAVRYDYFETPVSINGEIYIAKFDVEAVPGANNYRTHQIVKIDLTPAEASLAGPAPVASSETSSPVEGTRPLNFDFTIS